MILRYQGDDLQEFVVYVLADQKVLCLFTTYTHALYSSIRTLTTATNTINHYLHSRPLFIHSDIDHSNNTINQGPRSVHHTK